MDEATALRIKDELLDAGLGAVRAGMGRAARPATLYHFTDCQGLIGILTGRSFWASLATGLNDESEVRYAVTRAEGLLRSNLPAGIDRSFLAAVERCLCPENSFTGVHVEFDAYVISFCARHDRSVHWLHYGGSGTGCAIGLETDVLVGPPFDLAPVIYDEAAQDKYLSSIIERVWSVVRRYNIDSKDSAAAALLFGVAAESAAVHVRMAAPALKCSAFASEEEWRLITYDVRLDGAQAKGDAPLETRFRHCGGRVVPYLEYRLREVPITELVIGASSPMDRQDDALRVLLRKAAGLRPVSVVRSAVPVRP